MKYNHTILILLASLSNKPQSKYHRSTYFDSFTSTACLKRMLVNPCQRCGRKEFIMREFYGKQVLLAFSGVLMVLSLMLTIIRIKPDQTILYWLQLIYVSLVWPSDYFRPLSYANKAEVSTKVPGAISEYSLLNDFNV